MRFLLISVVPGCFSAGDTLDDALTNAQESILLHLEGLLDEGMSAPEEQKMALAALQQAVLRLEKQFGDIEIPWGRVNITIRGDTFPMDGNSQYGVLHPDGGMEQDDGRIHCNDGWGHLLVVMEGDPKEVWSLLPYGQAEDPSSPHYNDQARLHSKRQAKRFWLKPSEILAHTESAWGDRDRLRRWIRK